MSLQNITVRCVVRQGAQRVGQKTSILKPEILASPVNDGHDFQGMAEVCESSLPQTFTRCVKIGMIFTGWQKNVSVQYLWL
jgi:hypothetical protein